MKPFLENVLPLSSARRRGDAAGGYVPRYHDDKLFLCLGIYFNFTGINLEDFPWAVSEEFGQFSFKI